MLRKTPMVFSFVLAFLLTAGPMAQDVTRVFYDTIAALRDPNITTIVNEGGTGSSKTVSSLQALHLISTFRTKPLLTSIVSESFPHLKLGAMRDFFRYVVKDEYEEARWNKSDHIYRYDTAQIEFFSADQPGKVHGPRRDILYLNEANNIPYEVCDQLVMRTRAKVLVDHNPTGEYWAHDIKGEQTTAWIHSTYKDALGVLPPQIVKKIEARKDKDPNWWNVYGRGLVGMVTGLVHPLFKQVDEMPKGDGFYGLDFGYTNDPTVLTFNFIIGDNLYSDEVIYETGLKNNDIARLFKQHGVRKGYDEIYADSEDPKSIETIAEYGYNIKGVAKPPGSVVAGVEHINEYRQHWTKRSLNCIKEQRNYRYIKDRMGKLTQKPVDAFNHGMDSRRYAVVGHEAEAIPGAFSV